MESHREKASAPKPSKPAMLLSDAPYHFHLDFGVETNAIFSRMPAYCPCTDISILNRLFIVGFLVLPGVPEKGRATGMRQHSHRASVKDWGTSSHQKNETLPHVPNNS